MVEDADYTETPSAPPYTTTKDIKSIIITYTAATKNEVTEATKNIAGTVTIKTGPVAEGNCNEATQEFTHDPLALEITATNATITPNEGKTATLKIDINITDLQDNADALDALAHLAIPHSPCSVNVNDTKLTIKIKYNLGKNKCFKIEITLTADALGLQSTDNASVYVAPPPNHLTIKYGSVEKTAALPKTAAEDKEAQAKGMTEITEKIAEKIAEKIKETATATSKDHSGAKTYYSVKNDETKIRYYFTLKAKPEANKPITKADATIIVHYVYGHIFAEGFSDTGAKSSMISPLPIVLVGMGLVYGHYRDTRKDVTTYHKTEDPDTKVPPMVSYPKSIDLEDLDPKDITKITVTNKDGKTIATYTQDQGEATPAPGDPTLIIKNAEGGETTATYTKQEGTAPTTEGTNGTPNTIILSYTRGGTNSKGYITLTGKPTNATVHFGHIFTEKFDTSTVRPHIVSPTLMVIVGMGLLCVWMGNWGGSHDPDKANGDLTLTSTNGSYTSTGNTITLTINEAKYKTGSTTGTLGLVASGGDNTLVLTSTGNIATGGGPYNLTRGNLTLNLNAANTALNGKTYNVSLNITSEISLTGGGCSGCKLKPTSFPVSLGSYKLTTGDNLTYTGQPETKDIHSDHSTTKCCMFGNQNTWSTKPGMYRWHSPLYFICAIRLCWLWDFDSQQRVSLLHTVLLTFTYYIVLYI